MTKAIEDIVQIGKKSITIADIGAAFLGQKQVYGELIERGIANLVAFEPDPRKLEDLRVQLGPSANIIPHALGDGKIHTLYLGPPDSGMTSLLKPDEDYLKYFNGFSSFGKVFGTQQIQTICLDQCQDVQEIDYLKMDIQGSELSVLQHGMSKLRECTFIQLEISFVPLYEDQPTFGEIDQHIRRFGFLPHCFAEVKRWSISPTIRGGNFRIPFNQLLEADIVYIKNIVKLPLGAESLQRMAVIAHYCYKSPDLAAKCILNLVEGGHLPPDSRDDYYRSLSSK